MIRNNKDYKIYLSADRISNGIYNESGVVEFFRNFFFPNYIWLFIKSMRKVEYYANTPSNPVKKVMKFFALRQFYKLSYKLGFSIPINTFGPGVSIAHYGTIVINQSVRIGANCRIHAGVNIGSEAGHASRAPVLGDNCYIGPGAKLFGDIQIADGTAIGANAVVNRSVLESCTAVAGIPAQKISSIEPYDIIIPGSLIAALDKKPDLKGLSAKEVHVELKNQNLLKY